jgi:hypothetical protein
MLEIPGYRVRLFLSADISGSTAFKAKASDGKWVKVFRTFYSSFLNQYVSNYLGLCQEVDPICSITSAQPCLWKTIGDEVIFVNRVDSCFEVFVYVHAFVRTLREYGETLASSEETRGLDIKGNGWLASFPHPNQTFKLPDPTHSKEDCVDSPEEQFLPSEEDELGADSAPHKYDFLGKGIDYGFRIGKNSREDFLTISPALANVLCVANTTKEFENYEFGITFEGTGSLKGVLNGEPYPIIGINTERNRKRYELNQLEKTLSGRAPIDTKELDKYIEIYIEFHKIEKPNLKIKTSDKDRPIPSYYTDSFVPEWNAEYKEGKAQDKSFADSSSQPVEDSNKKENKEKLSKIANELEQIEGPLTPPQTPAA